MKYNNKDYLVRDNRLCFKLRNICFVPFSGNGINICRLWERGLCPTEEECKERLRIYKILIKKQKQKTKAQGFFNW